MLEKILRDLINAGAEAKRIQNRMTDADSEHICRACIAKLSNAYHAIMQGDVDEDLVAYYDEIIELAEEKDAYEDFR